MFKFLKGQSKQCLLMSMSIKNLNLMTANVNTHLMLVWPPRSHTAIINIYFNIVYCVTHMHLET